MRVDISIPNPISEAAEQLAQELGMSLSELYTAALSAYVARYRDVTQSLDRVYSTETSTIDPALLEMQAVSLDGEAW